MISKAGQAVLKQSNVMFIVAGGPSVNDYPVGRLHEHGCVLGVNDAFKHIKCHAVASMDGRWMGQRLGTLGTTKAHCFLSRLHYNKHALGLIPLGGLDTPVVNTADVGFGVSWDGSLIANNSGVMALNLAWLAKPDVVYLLGFDHTNHGGDAHWYSDYPWRQNPNDESLYRHWVKDHTLFAELFKQAGIKVYNASSISVINDYERLSNAEFKDHLARILGPK